MYCRKCGNEVKDYNTICSGCGIRPLNAMNFCQSCGAPTDINQEQCIKCMALLRSIKQVVGNPVIKTDFSYLSGYYREEFKRIYESNETYKGSWNWSAFIFSCFWAIQKGMWLSGIICLILSVPTAGITTIVYSFIFGARGNYIYYTAHAKEKQLPW